ncbi:hypothetical protein MJ904_19580 [Massilia sp. MB5]|uniref:hypothetical protein n=1 Tax=Massilia sp. MB5 TaxID=2919578 RepID=UPI001F0EBD5B|nr:hypothetical protein [Massilia sp. MB5]UMR29268.1 hypothetical protein MJ904_19580 [Massilia sp. MB5]
MKDRISLLLAAAVCAGGAWAFWHFLGANAADALLTMVVLTLTADNVRLRRKLRREGKA